MDCQLLKYIYIIKMSETATKQTFQKNERIVGILKNPKINTYTSDYVVQSLSQNSLVKLQQFMRKNKNLKIAGFMRFFRELIPFDKNQTSQENQFFLYYSLFKLFQQICNNKKKVNVSFSDISSYIAQKMPNFTQQNIIQQKLLPLGLNIDQTYKAHITPPDIYGQILQDRVFLTTRPIISDRIQHINRDVGQSEYSKKFKLYFSIDKPSDVIHIYNENFDEIQILKTQQQMTKRDMIVNYIAWSDRQQKIACILGNYSISMWSKDDNYKYQVNIPLPGQYLSNPYVMIKYMDSMRKWITLDNRPAIYVLNNKDYQPEYFFINQKINKKKQSQKMNIIQLHYVSLLCIGFQRSIFLVSLKNKQIVSQIHNFRTSITSIAFSQSFQALFVSTYEKYFRSYELSQHQDLIQRGTFQGHKSQISLLGVIQKKPIVFSLQQNSVLKMFDMRDYTCYQSFSVLKNILYKQVLYLNDAICFVGSKMHVYGIQKQIIYKQKQVIIYIGTLHKNLLVVSTKNIKVFNIRNGALISVIKAIFAQKQSSSDIFSVFVMHNKQKLMIQSEEGQCVILQTKQMSEVQKWKFQPKPSYMFLDSEYDLLTQVSLGNINVNQFYNESCQIQLRRTISNQDDIIRFIKVNPKHDLMAICYESDQNIYFYSYEKGKMLGFLNFGQKNVIKFKNAYKSHKTIHKVVDIEFYENKNVIFLLLSNQLLVLTYKKSLSAMSFMIKKQIKLWISPLVLSDNKQYVYDQKQFEQPLHSTKIELYENTAIVTCNKACLICSISAQIDKIDGIQQVYISKQNYNPNRIGNQVHTGVINKKNPMITIKDITPQVFNVSYYFYKQRLGDFVKCQKIGNLLSIADSNLNIILIQNANWSQIAGIINFQQTLPKLWNIFNYSQQQIKQIQFILNFIENQSKLPETYNIKTLAQQQNSNKNIQSQNFSQITISQLIKQDRLKGGIKSYRSCSLRQKKMVLEKQRQQRAKLQNFLLQQKQQKKQKPDNSNKNYAQKQINQTLGYLSLNHNETVLKRGFVEQELPAVKALQKKLNASINKEQKKSLVSYKTGDQSTKTKKHKDILPTPSLSQLKMAKTLSTQIYENLTQKIGLKRYNSRQLIQKLNHQKFKSQNNLSSNPSRQSLPKIRIN